MRLTGFLIQTALRHLWRSRQRNLVALLCIIFGAMSLVAMTLLSTSIARVMMLKPGEMIGADLSINRRLEDYIMPEQITNLDSLKAQSLIDQYTLIAHFDSLALSLPGTGEMQFINSGLGIDPVVYPLVGQFQVGMPGNIGLPTLLHSTGDVLITRDIAIENQLKVGDLIKLSNFATGISTECHIQGIVTDTPNHQGGKIYFTYTTAALLTAEKPYLNLALATSSDPQTVKKALEENGWSVHPARAIADSQKAAEDLFDFSLRGAGILGLLVGGIGIANTMQVLLSRQRKEVAIWKTLGYQEWQLQTLFATEVGILGATGSLLGAGIGVAVSYKLVELFNRTTNLLISWQFSLYPVVNGVLVGTLTTVIFAMIAIVTAGQTSPMSLLRLEQPDTRRIPWHKTAGLVLLLGAPFLALTSLAMGSLAKGAGVLLFALTGLVILGGILSGFSWTITRLLPLKWLPLAQMAKNNLQRRGLSLIFAMIALFTGIVSLSLGFVITQSAQREMEERNLAELIDYNLAVIAPLAQESDLRQEIGRLPVEKISDGYKSTILAIQGENPGGAIYIQPVLVSRSEPHDYEIEGAAWGSVPEGVYVPQYSEIPTGSLVTLTLWDHSTRELEVVGRYSTNYLSNPTRESGLLVSNTLIQQVGTPDAVQIFARLPAAQVQSATKQMGSSLPEITVVNLLAYSARFVQTYHNLFILAVAMASLALLAGILLIANSVNLAILNRRYEIGVLRAMGYSRGHIMYALVVEYGLVALIASAAGLAAVYIFFVIVGMTNPLAASLLILQPQAAAIILLIGTGLALLAVTGVAWRPTQVSPLVVLNDGV